MDTSSKKISVPEEEELTSKRAKLTNLLETISEKELELTSLRSLTLDFERTCFADAGAKYVEPDHRNARIAYKIKKIYRQIAVKIHPDKTKDKAKKKHRTKLMAEANSAYTSGDMNKLNQILCQWYSSPDSADGEGTGGMLAGIIRTIAQMNSRLRTIKQEIKLIKNSEIYKMMECIIKAKKNGRDLLRKTYTSKGNYYARLGQYQRAIENYDQAISIDPTNADAYNSRGHVYAALDQTKKAINDFNRAIDLDLETPLIYCKRSRACENFDQYQKLTNIFKQSVKARSR